MITCAFMYIAPGLDPLKQHAVIPSEDVPMYVVGVGNYDQAEAIASGLGMRHWRVGAAFAGHAAGVLRESGRAEGEGQDQQEAEESPEQFIHKASTFLCRILPGVFPLRQ